MRGIGIMSGSSLDGLDMVLVEFGPSNSQWTMHLSEVLPIPVSLKKDLSGILSSDINALAETESDYSEFISNSVNDWIKTHQLQADFLAIHGHTILHWPDKDISWQLLNGGMICSKTDMPVICDFRNQDIALGGQGSPMAVLADRDLFPGYDFYLNLGGIANMSLKGEKWSSYDLCPCNQVLNYFASRQNQVYDRDGLLAQRGVLNHQLLDRLLQDEYIQKQAPKSIDNQEIQKHWLPMIQSFQDTDVNVLRTFTEFIAEVVTRGLKENGSRLLVSGGGANNSYLISVIREKLTSKNVELIMPDKEIIDFKEAILIAYAGYLRMNALPNFVSDATGASRDTVGGALYLPSKPNPS